MLTESLTVLAAAGGSAVATAAGTDAWAGLRGRVAALFGRGDQRVADTTLERLDRAASELENAEGDQRAEVRARTVTVWRTRFEDLLEGLDESDRAGSAEQLRELVEMVADRDGDARKAVVAGDGAMISEHVDIRADQGSFAAGTADISGSVTLGAPPPQPGT